MRLRTPQIQVPIEEIFAFCSRNYIRSLALFGSVLSDDFGEDSDIDVLVEFEPGHIPGFQFFAMQEELGEIFARKIDLNTLGFLIPSSMQGFEKRHWSIMSNRDIDRLLDMLAASDKGISFTSGKARRSRSE